MFWKLCEGFDKSDVISFLRKDNFDGLMSASDIITRLGQSKIGTTDEEIIEKVISFRGYPTIEIKIFSPKDAEPKEDIVQKVANTSLAKSSNKIYLKRS